MSTKQPNKFHAICFKASIDCSKYFSVRFMSVKCQTKAKNTYWLMWDCFFRQFPTISVLSIHLIFSSTYTQITFYMHNSLNSFYCKKSEIVKQNFNSMWKRRKNCSSEFTSSSDNTWQLTGPNLSITIRQ